MKDSFLIIFSIVLNYAILKNMQHTSTLEALLQWYITAGADETIQNESVNRFLYTNAKKEDLPISEEKVSDFIIPNQTFVPSFALEQTAPTKSASFFIQETQTQNLADQADNLDELKTIILNFNECPLKNTATNMVFGNGNPHAALMIIGEAPGAEEDKQGLPFVGASGHLLTLMLQSIGLNRDDVYISNILPWRPPGNRKPTEAETALFLPFVRKHIALINPKILLLLGSSATSALLQTNAGITKIRGRWMNYTDGHISIKAMPSFHPAFLLRNPAQKKYSWRDFLCVQKVLFN